MSPMKIPESEKKCGVKIDFVARHLGTVLAPHGFGRKGRKLFAAVGVGNERHWQILQLQAGKWNEGPYGDFFVNLAVQYPELTRLSARRTGLEWLTQYIDQVDESLGQVRQRLGYLQSQLPASDPLSRTPPADEYRITPTTDLQALAQQLEVAAVEIALPWFARHGSLQALIEGDGRSCQPVRLVAEIGRCAGRLIPPLSA